ncbi:adenosine kinase [Psychrobacter sp. FDAARGOS_221]|uniref:adenosine kinase n=1 Tax=Psychrobacter sp. FDAARGOS_221 TaxID=1975705 RepID=UPI000BB56423|nr:adenosine kinase [Psychrobacter sp. FDAARGOS_221]PNK61316.1 adenosine kinase [Psychrobacter sp. FDAARGOS_221]
MYNVMAIGNALVDHEYLLSDEQLTQTSLSKGSMTLASLEEQTQLLDTFVEQQLQPSNQAGGGSAANAMFAFASLGGTSFYGCRVGDDDAGAFYLNDLNKAGVATNNELSVAKDGVTGSCVVAITPDGERTMQTFLGTSSEIDANNIDLNALAESDWLYYEGYLAMSEALRPALRELYQQAKANNTKIAVSFADPAVVNFAKDGLLEILAEGVDAIFCNVEEAMLFTDTDNIQQAAKALTEYSTLAVVTNGPSDTLICQRLSADEMSMTSVTPPKVDKVIDTNGAGDNYSGAFLYALHQGHDLNTCGKLAGKVASHIVQQFGPRLKPEQYQQITQQILG